MFTSLKLYVLGLSSLSAVHLNRCHCVIIVNFLCRATGVSTPTRPGKALAVSSVERAGATMGKFFGIPSLQLSLGYTKDLVPIKMS